MPVWATPNVDPSDPAGNELLLCLRDEQTGAVETRRSAQLVILKSNNEYSVVTTMYQGPDYQLPASYTPAAYVQVGNQRALVFELRLWWSTGNCNTPASFTKNACRASRQGVLSTIALSSHHMSSMQSQGMPATVYCQLQRAAKYRCAKASGRASRWVQPHCVCPISRGAFICLSLLTAASVCLLLCDALQDDINLVIYDPGCNALAQTGTTVVPRITPPCLSEELGKSVNRRSVLCTARLVCLI